MSIILGILPFYFFQCMNEIYTYRNAINYGLLLVSDLVLSEPTAQIS